MLSEEIEEELRSAFARAAAEYPDPEQARERVLQGDYRPGSRRGLAAGMTAAAGAAAVGLGLGLSGAFGAAPGYDTSTIRTTAFTLAHNADGTESLTINPLVLFYPGTLQKDLARHGIPARVTIGSFCSSDPAPAGFSKVVSPSPLLPAGRGHAHKPKITINPGNPMITINPATMPAGAELSVGVFQVASGLNAGLRTAVALIDTNSHTCSSKVPTKPPPDGSLDTLTVPAFPPGT